MFAMKGKGLGGAGSARQIKAWARELLAPGDSDTIMVSELACSEPGCPPIETVIAVLRGPGDATHYKLHRASAEITRDDIARLAAAPCAEGT